MSSLDIFAVSNSFWTEICSKLQNSIVYIDNGAAECLHWTSGLLRLYENGALDVKEFSSFESSSAEHCKAVFILASPLWRVTLNILQDIIRNSQIQDCLIFTSVDTRVHSLLKYGTFEGGVTEKDPMNGLRNQILEWMGNKEKKTGTNDEMQFYTFPLELQVFVSQFVSNFNAVMEMLNCRESYYSIGQFSRIVSTELEDLPAGRARRKVATNRISVLFMDRSLDLAQAASYSFETLLDRIVHLLPKISNHSLDVAVDISPLCHVKMPTDSNCDQSLLVPGSLAHSNDRTAATILNEMVTNKHKNCFLEINRHLVEAVSKHRLSEEIKLSRVTADTMLAMVEKFKNKPNAIENCLGVLQQSLAAVQALKHPDNSKIDTLLGIEKALMQMLGEADISNSKVRIAHLIKERKTRGLTIEDILILLVRVCSLKGKGFVNAQNEQLEMLKAVLGDAFLQDYDLLPDYLKHCIGPEVDELTIHAMVTKLFEALYNISNTREDFKKYISIFNEGTAVQPSSYTPLIKQLLDDIWNPSKPDLVDLECRTTGLRDILKSGLGLFMNVNKPRPSDNQTMLIFVLGGITSTEIRQIREAVTAHKSNMQVLIGSTRITSPRDTLQLLIESLNGLWC